MAGIDVRHLGEFIREQRDLNNISLRQLAKLAGVSNPYLSQIERGLRKPSAEILQQIAKGLRISAEALYVQAGILDQRHDAGLVADAVLTDEGLTERQKQVLLEIYDSFRKENAASTGGDATVSLVTATTELPTGLSTDERSTDQPSTDQPSTDQPSTDQPPSTDEPGTASRTRKPRGSTPRSPSPRKRAGGPAAST